MRTSKTAEVEWGEDPWDMIPVIGAGAPGSADAGADSGLGEGVGGECAVECDALDTPSRLVHRGREFQVLQPGMHWYERRNWWESEGRVPRESLTSAVDEERWRVQAVQVGATAVQTFDLTRDRLTERWELLRVSAG